MKTSRGLYLIFFGLLFFIAGCGPVIHYSQSSIQAYIITGDPLDMTQVLANILPFSSFNPAAGNRIPLSAPGFSLPGSIYRHRIDTIIAVLQKK